MTTKTWTVRAGGFLLSQSIPARFTKSVQPQTSASSPNLEEDALQVVFPNQKVTSKAQAETHEGLTANPLAGDRDRTLLHGPAAIERSPVYLDGPVAKGWEDQQEPAQATSQYVDPMHSALVPRNELVVPKVPAGRVHSAEDPPVFTR